MRNFLRGLGQLLASLLAILFVITLTTALLVVNIEARLFNARLYMQVFDEQDLYNRLPSLAAETIVVSMIYDPCMDNPIACESEQRSIELEACLTNALGPELYVELVSDSRTPTEAELALAEDCFVRYGKPERSDGPNGQPTMMKYLTVQDWENIITILMPPEELRTMLEQTLTQVFDVLDGKSDTATLSLVRLKQRLTGEAGAQAVEQLITAQPPCSAAGEQLMRQIGAQDMELCNPSPEVLAEIRPRIQEQLLGTVASMPDEAVLIGEGAAGQAGAGLQMARLVMRLSPLLPLALLLGITLFAVRSLKGWLRWWGIPFLISAAIGLLIALVAPPLLQMAFAASLTGAFPAYLPRSLLTLSLEVGSELLHTLLEPYALQMVLIGGAGLAMLIGSFFVKQESAE